MMEEEKVSAHTQRHTHAVAYTQKDPLERQENSQVDMKQKGWRKKSK